MTDSADLIWAKASDVALETTPIAPGLLMCSNLQARAGTRPMYSTLTSGSAGAPKMAFAFGDALELVALQYDHGLYRLAFPEGRQVRTLATCLPLAYAATFMMVVVPALMLGYSLVAFPPDRWSTLFAEVKRGPLACLTVPSLLTAAAVSSVEPLNMSNLALFATAGYLSRSRIDMATRVFRNARLLTSYGASETGVMTLDATPDGQHFHVGRPITGKAVWIVDADGSGVGKIATTGPDCREFYRGIPGFLRDHEGVVVATDYGRFDPDGNLYLEGRIDGGTKLHGITVYTRTLERHVLRMAGVVDVRASIVNTATVDRLELQVLGSVGADQVREFCQEMPEIYRPAIIRCDGEGIDQYSDRGKLNANTSGSA